jgi:hypothetical protein
MLTSPVPSYLFTLGRYIPSLHPLTRRVRGAECPAPADPAAPGTRRGYLPTGIISNPRYEVPGTLVPSSEEQLPPFLAGLRRRVSSPNQDTETSLATQVVP